MANQIHVPENYRFETFEFKQGGKGGISLDVWYPTRITHGPLRTIVYYHGGFLVCFPPFLKAAMSFRPRTGYLT